MEENEDLFVKNQEDVVSGPSIVFTLKAIVNETFIRKSPNSWRSNLGIDTSQLYTYPNSQPMPSDLYTRRDLNSRLVDSRLGKKRPVALKIW